MPRPWKFCYLGMKISGPGWGRASIHCVEPNKHTKFQDNCGCSILAASHLNNFADLKRVHSAPFSCKCSKLSKSQIQEWHRLVTIFPPCPEAVAHALGFVQLPHKPRNIPSGAASTKSAQPAASHGFSSLETGQLLVPAPSRALRCVSRFAFLLVSAQLYVYISPRPSRGQGWVFGWRGVGRLRPLSPS